MKRTLLPRVIGLVALWAASLAAAQAAATDDGFFFPGSGLRVKGQAILLGIDDEALPLRRNVCLYLSRPVVRKEPVLTPSRDDPGAPDFMAAHFYGGVVRDPDKFRLWYYAAHLKPGSTNDMVEGPVCYAESADGIQWTKPNLGQVLFNGSRDNNGVALPGERTEGVMVIRDDADPDAERRYKMIYNIVDRQYAWTLRTATSADGLRWTAGPEHRLHTFLEFCSLYHHGGYYFINAQTTGLGEGGRPQGRQGYVWLSPDFQHWLEESALSFALPEPEHGPDFDGRYDQVHLGVAATSLGNVVVGLYAIWHQRGWGVGGTTCDLGLVLSRDGIHFHEPVKGHVFLSHQDSPVTPVPGKNYPTILVQANGIVNCDRETRLYHGRWRNVAYPSKEALDYWGEVALATLPRDRWGALGLAPGSDEGTVWSEPIRFPDAAAQLRLNADAADQMSVELADERFVPLPEFSGPKAGAARAKAGLDCPVTWPAGSLEAARGKIVRLRLQLRRTSQAAPRLFAVYLAENGQAR
jgi:hypothetical protein